MKKGFSIYIFFVVLAMGFVSSAFYHTVIKSDPSEAGGFGISPPYIHAEPLKPGDTYSQRIRVMRSGDSGDKQVTARFDESSISNWFTTEPAETINIKDGEHDAYFNFILQVPIDAYNGSYETHLYFAIGESKRGQGVGIRLGARADVTINIVGGKEREIIIPKEINPPLVLNESALLNRLQGMFIMRVEDAGQIYYLHPNENKLYHIGTRQNFFDLVADAGRGIRDELLNQIPVNLDVKTEINHDLVSSLVGFLLLQVDNKGQIWYVNPRTNTRSEISTNDDFLLVLSKISLGIGETSFNSLLK